MRWVKFISFLLLTVSIIACRRESTNTGTETHELGLFLSTPATTVTKASVGPVAPAPDADFETALHSLEVWVFESEGSHAPVAHRLLETGELPQPGRLQYYAVPVSADFARTRPDVDVFALANAASIGVQLDANSTWQDVKEAAFGVDGPKDYFGVNDPVRAVRSVVHNNDTDSDEVQISADVRLTENGLPMSGIGMGMAVQGEDPVLRLEKVTLQRAVSKLRYVFCKTASDSEDKIVINSITLNGQTFPLNEYVFPSSAPFHIVQPTEGPTYQEDGLNISFGESWPLSSNERPEKLVYSGQAAAYYETLLNDAVDARQLTDLGTTYLRETNKILKGSITFTINDNPASTKTFTMNAEQFNYDFARNHTWTLYGYFLSGRRLQLSIRALPWDYNEYDVDFASGALVAWPFQLDEETWKWTVKDPEQKDYYIVTIPGGHIARGSVRITNPAGGKLFIRGLGEQSAFEIKPDICNIDASENDGRIDITIGRNPNFAGDYSGKSILISFAVELNGDDVVSVDGEGRIVDANSELLNGDTYKFVLQ